MAGQTLLTQQMPLVLETVQKAPRRHAALHLRVVAAVILPTAIQAVIDFLFVGKLFHTNFVKMSRSQNMQNRCSQLQAHFFVRCILSCGIWQRENVATLERQYLHDGVMFYSSKIVDDREPMYDSCFLDMFVPKAFLLLILQASNSSSS